LLLDEPFASLDYDTRTQLRTALKRVQAALGPTIILVTHDPEDVAALAEAVVDFANGVGVPRPPAGDAPT